MSAAANKYLGSYWLEVSSPFTFQIDTAKPSRMHVYADLKPYICTFEACSDMLNVFPSRKLWAEHEAINHFSDSFYECHDCERNFQEEAHFRIHLAKSHYVSDLNHAQSLVIISAAKSSKVRAFTGQFCPLCKQTGWPTQRVYFTHLGKHLEQIALSALPPDPDSDSESEPSQDDAASYRDNSGNTNNLAIACADNDIIGVTTLEQEPSSLNLPDIESNTPLKFAQRNGPAHVNPPHNADSDYNVLPPPSSILFPPMNLPDRVPTPSSAAATGKRTPSATHPYTLSESFYNRYHKCERVDALNRGIWTSYGPGGTADNPTGPKVEMYLRCSHENCLRMDWRTVHGLQCHIVKNHEQPKGTIGSLEKALDRYGVPVSDIYEYERIDGPGSGGTMKNTKPKSGATPRTSEIMPSTVTLGNPRVQLPSETPTPPPAVSAPNNLLFPRISQRTPSRGFIQNDIVYSDDDEEGKVEVKEGEKDELKMQNLPASGIPLVTAVTEVPPVSEEKKENAGPSEDTEMAYPSMGKAYNQAQRELQGNNDSGESDNEDYIVVRRRPRSPPRRTRKG
jgi:hypothetical protein